jgi:recombination protein RecT
MTAILKNPDLAMCEPSTFFGSLLQALQLGLEVNTPLGQAYLIPRRKNDKNGRFMYWECNFQMGYQGMLELCYRSKQYEVITARIVYDGDDFDYQYGTGQHLHHSPRNSTDKPVYAYGYYKLREGGEDFVVWKYEKALRHGAEFSDAFESRYAPWKKNAETQEAMVKKTMLKQVLHYAPKAVELAGASMADGHAVIAGRYEEAGETRLRFDVKQIEAPDRAEQEFTDRVQRGVKPEADKEPVSAARKQEGAVTGDTAPAREQTAYTENAAQRNRSDGDGKPANTAPAAGTGKTAGLFQRDEEAELAEQYEREQTGAGLPDFS